MIEPRDATPKLAAGLRPLASRLGARVAEWEILRVAGRLPSWDDLDLARREVLRWAQPRSGTALPAEAWDGAEFSSFVGGRTCLGAVFDDGKRSFWGLKIDDPDKNVPSRVWTTEIVVGGARNDELWFSLRLNAHGARDIDDVIPHSPGIVLQIADKIGLYRSNLRISRIWYPKESDTDRLLALILSPKRRLPVILASLDDSQGFILPQLDLEKLGRACIGTAHVVALSPTIGWALTQRVGARRSLFHGGMRLYEPGFHDSDDPYRHPLFLGSALRESTDRDSALTMLRKHVASLSIRNLRLGKDVISFAQIFSASSAERGKKLYATGASFDKQLTAARDQIKALELQLAEAEDSAETALDLASEAESSRDEALSRLEGMRGRILQMEMAIKKENIVEENFELPSNWVGFVQWCDEKFAGRLRLLTRARREIRAPLYSKPELAAEALKWLAFDACDSLRGLSNLDILNAPVASGLRNAPCGKDSYKEGSYEIDKHIKNNANTRDPARCLRIYWGWDAERQEIVVADMPAHRDTALS